jgi:UDP-N-acetylmuramyl pentapeptide phosphotransferase/UDP-N-acetylglucosamine-1-phosphate transferase
MTLLALSVASTSALPGGKAVSLIMVGLVVIGLLDDRWGIPSGVRLICYLAAGIALPWMVFADVFAHGCAVVGIWGWCCLVY